MKWTSSKVLVAALVAAVGAVDGGCSGDQKTSYDYLSKARDYVAAGNDNAAVIELKNALQKDPKNGDARLLLAQIDNRRGNGAAAEIEIHKAMELGLAKATLEPDLGQALLLQGEYQQALDGVNPADAADGGLAARLYAVRGDAYIGLNKAQEARAAFDKAVKLAPGAPDGYLGLARLAIAGRDMKEAFHEIDVALAKSPDDVKALTMKGDLLWAQGQDKEGEAAFSRVLHLQENNVPVRLRLVSMALDRDQLAAARTRLEDLSKLAANDLRVKYMQALLHFREKAYGAAKDALQDVTKASPDYMPAVLLSGVIDYELGLYEQAHQSLSRFSFQFPRSAYAAKFLAATDLKLRHPKDAVKDLDAVVNGDTKDTELLALLGQAYMENKNYAQATAFFARAAAIDTQDSGLKAQLGAARLAAGDTGRAIADLQSAVRLNPDQYKTDAILVTAALQAKDYDKALSAAQAWEKKRPDNPVAYNLEGMALLGKRDTAGARKRFEKALAVRGDYVPAAMSLAQLDMRGGDRGAAKKWFETVIKTDGSNLQAEMALAGLAQGAGDNAGVEQWLEKAIKQHPNLIQPRQVLAAHYLGAGQAKKALGVAEAAQGQEGVPGPDALDLLGQVQLATGDTAGALDTYSRLVNTVPGSPLAYLKLAQAQQAAKQVKDAESSLNQALSLNPNFTDAKVALVSLKAMNGQSRQALRAAREIQHAQPQSPMGFDLEGNILMQEKQYLPAAKAYEQANQRADSAITLRHIYRAYMKAGEPDKALAALRGHLDKHPDDTAVRLALAQGYSARQDRKAAAAQYQAVLRRNPDNLLALNNLAWIYLEEKDPGAVRLAQRAYQLRPDNAAAADTLGWALVQQGQTRNALDVLEKAASLAKGAPTITYHYAVALAQAGDKAQARKRLQALLSDGRPFPERADAQALLKRM